MRIIVVEDDSGIRDAMQLVLERAGHEVTLYNDGSLILDNNFSVPDMFIIDKQLPGVDGLDICKHLKSNSDAANIPVLMMSASPHAAVLAKEACADEFLEKPFKNKKLLEIIARY